MFLGSTQGELNRFMNSIIYLLMSAQRPVQHWTSAASPGQNPAWDVTTTGTYGEADTRCTTALGAGVVRRCVCKCDCEEEDQLHGTYYKDEKRWNQRGFYRLSGVIGKWNISLNVHNRYHLIVLDLKD